MGERKKTAKKKKSNKHVLFTIGYRHYAYTI